jgi:glycosyltransferase involved in cell wall biosynthesis
LKVSIITPSYNQAHFVRQTMESVLSQGCQDLEYIVVEGGSTDQSKQVIQEYAQKGVLTLIDYPGSSQAQAINKGLTAAKGEILAWLNSDDIYLHGAIKLVATFFAAHPEADVIYGHELSINTQNEVIGFRLIKAGLNSKKALWEGISIPQPAVFFRRRVYERLGGLNEDFEFVLDTEYWYRMIREFRFLELPQLLAATRHHKDAKTGLGSGGSVFGRNYRDFYREGAQAFLIHGGTRLAPYYLQNRVNRYVRNYYLRWFFSHLINIYSKITIKQ